MELLVIRHGIAVDRAKHASEAADARRPLTSRGRRRFRRSIRGLRRLGVRIDHVLTSPWRRAVETAALLEPLLTGEVRATARLAETPRAELLAELAALGDARVAVVGHEPWLGSLIALLTGATTQIGESFGLKKGGLAWLDGAPAPGAMHLRAVLPPRVLRRIR